VHPLTATICPDSRSMGVAKMLSTTMGSAAAAVAQRATTRRGRQSLAASNRSTYWKVPNRVPQTCRCIGGGMEGLGGGGGEDGIHEDRRWSVCWHLHVNHALLAPSPGRWPRSRAGRVPLRRPAAGVSSDDSSPRGRPMWVMSNGVGDVFNKRVETHGGPLSTPQCQTVGGSLGDRSPPLT
jgi:hypothetical protein